MSIDALCPVSFLVQNSLFSALKGSQGMNAQILGLIDLAGFENLIWSEG
jgi:hypothetical protein